MRMELNRCREFVYILQWRILTSMLLIYGVCLQQLPKYVPVECKQSLSYIFRSASWCLDAIKWRKRWWKKNWNQQNTEHVLCLQRKWNIKYKVCQWTLGVVSSKQNFFIIERQTFLYFSRQRNKSRIIFFFYKIIFVSFCRLTLSLLGYLKTRIRWEGAGVNLTPPL